MKGNLLPSRLREGFGGGPAPPHLPTPLRLASKLASLAAPPLKGRGDNQLIFVHVTVRQNTLTQPFIVSLLPFTRR